MRIPWPLFIVVLAGCQAAAKQQDSLGIGTSAPAMQAAASSLSATETPAGSTLAFQTDHKAEPINYTLDAKSPARENEPAGAPAVAGATIQPVSGQFAVPLPLAETPPAQELVAPGAVQTPPILTLDDALAIAVMNNPDLRALRGSEWPMAAALGVAQTYPWNPNIQLNYAPKALSHVEPTVANYYVFVLQTIELAHQRRYREQLAAANLTQTRWLVLQGELTTLATALRQYLAAAYQRDLFELTRTTAEINENLRGTVERRYKAGLSTAAELAMAEAAHRQAKRQLQLAEANYLTALRALYQTAGMEIPEGTQLNASLTEFEWQPIQQVGELAVGCPTPQSALAAALVQSRPDVLAAEAAAASARGNERLARASKIPNLQTGPIYTSDDFGNQFLGVRAFMDAPVFNTGEPLVRQRHAEWHQRQLTLEQLRRRAHLEGQAAIARYERAYQLANASRPDFSDKTPAALRSMQAQFEAGQATILDVFSIQNTLLQDYRTFLDLLNELSQATADVVQATALPPQRLLSFTMHMPQPPAPEGGAP